MDGTKKRQARSGTASPLCAILLFEKGREMAKFWQICLLGPAIGLVAGGSAQGQSPSQAIMDVKARAADSRLDTPLTFDADRMYLGEVLEKVSAATGVLVSI